MLHDCETGKIDLILTKSISRFARNTTDCLELVRKLNALGISIYFEKEDLNTGDSESELILSILASLAEEESHSISSNCKWAVQKRFQNGSFKLSRPPYGYDLQNAYITMLNKLSYSRKDLLLPYINAVTTEDDHEIQQRLCRIRTKLQNIRMNRDDLVRRYSLGSIEASEFFEKTVACRREERELLREKSITERFFGHTFSAQALDQFISEWKIGTSRFPQSSFCALTDHILISDRNQVTFVMKCGLRLSEEIGSVKKSGSGR